MGVVGVVRGEKTAVVMSIKRVGRGAARMVRWMHSGLAGAG